MAATNREKQKRYRESRQQSGDRQLTCWISQADNDRLQRLMESLGYCCKGKLQEGYTEIIGLALESLERNLDKPGNKPRYGLVFFDKHNAQ